MMRKPSKEEEPNEKESIGIDHGSGHRILTGGLRECRNGRHSGKRNGIDSGKYSRIGSSGHGRVDGSKHSGIGSFFIYRTER